MTSSLFRKEALEYRKDRLYGDVILLQPLSMTLLVGATALICIMVLTILFWGTYARKETVHGYIIPDKGIVKTYTPQTGTVAKVHVKDGEIVREGQTLITIISERSLQGGSDIDSLLLKEYKSTQMHLEDRIKGEKNLLTSEKERLTTRIEGLGKELEQIEHSLKAQEHRISMLESRVSGAEKLLKNNNISQMEYQKLYEELLVLRQQLQDLLRAKAAAKNNLMQAQSELVQLPIKSQASIHEIENNISQIKQHYAEVEGRRGLEIRSPINGRITALQAREGLWQTTNTPLLAIIPDNAELQVELLVPSRAIGFISEGQIVRVRYDAFPFRRFGIYEGTVKVISKHILLPQELPIPLELKEPVYQVTVQLGKQYVNAYGKTFPLQAGMSLEADIILDKQSLFEWIFEPLFSLKGRL